MNLHHNRWLSRLASVAVLLAVAACAAPTVLNTQWSNPSFTSKPMRKILVVGITKDSSNRRVYEDAMVAQLNARGVQAMPSYGFAPEPGPVPQEVVQKAIDDFGASGVLLTRVVNVSQTVRVTPGMYMGPPRSMGFQGFHGFYSGMWATSFHSPPTITVTENVVADTRLFEARDFQIVWTASTTTSTSGSSSTTSLLQQFATLIATTLAQDGMI